MSNPLDDMMTDPSDTFVVQRDDATLEALDLDYDDVYKLAPGETVMDEFRSVDGTLSEVSQTLSGMAGNPPEYVEVRDSARQATFATILLNANAPSVKVAGASPARRRVFISAAASSNFVWISNKPIPPPYVNTQGGDWVIAAQFEICTTDDDIYVGCDVDTDVSVLVEYY